MTATDQKPNRGGAPKGNQNRMTHALKASKLPKDAKAEEHAGYAFRRLFMEALEVTHGKGRVPPGLQALVQTAHRRELEARLAARWLRREGDKLSVAERLALTSTISDASEARDKILTRLGVIPTADGKSPAHDDPWFALDQAAPLHPEKGPSSFSSPSEPKPAPFVEHAAEAPQTGTEKTERAIYDQSPFPAPGEGRHQPGVPETHFPPQTGENS